MSYGTFTSTYTVIDIRKTFEGFEADLRMIARRTGKWTTEYLEEVFHDIIKLAEAKYLSTISITLVNSFNEEPIRAAKYTVNANGTSITGDRAGGNDWPDLENTRLMVILDFTDSWKSLTEPQRQQFRATFKRDWSPTSIDNAFPHLTRQSAQTYGSNGYELKKDNYK